MPKTQDPTEQQVRAPEPATGKSPGRPRFYRLITGSVSKFIDDDCTTMGAALAYYTTFSIAPLLLIVISIAGLVFGRAAVQHDIQSQIEGLIGKGAASQIGAMVQSAGQHSSTGIVGSILGIVVLLIGATGAFTQLQTSLNQVWHVKPDPRVGGVRNFLGHRVLSLGMILAIAFLLLVSLAVTAALSAFGELISGFLPTVFSKGFLLALGFVVSLIIVAALFAAMYKVLPDVKLGWRNVWIGAGITAVLFDLGKFLIGLYLGSSGTANAYGAAGSFVLVVLWIYYSSLILLFGSEMTTVWTEIYGHPVEAKAGAIRVKTEGSVATVSLVERGEGDLAPRVF